MTEVFFYHLEHRPLEQVLPVLLEKSLERGWNSLVHVGKDIPVIDGEENEPSNSQKQQNSPVGFLDKALWAFRDDSFLPHCIFDSKKSQNENPELENYEKQLILLCAGEKILEGKNPNNAQIKFYVAGAVPTALEKMGEGEYKRLVFMFDGHDPDAVIEARQAWKNLSKTHQATYWQQDGSGNWMKKA